MTHDIEKLKTNKNNKQSKLEALQREGRKYMAAIITSGLLTIGASWWALSNISESNKNHKEIRKLKPRIYDKEKLMGIEVQMLDTHLTTVKLKGDFPEQPVLPRRKVLHHGK